MGINPNVRMRPDQMEEYVDLVMATADRWQGRLDVRLGLESDFVPDFVPWLEELHASQNFSYILGSVHPQADYYRGRVSAGRRDGIPARLLPASGRSGGIRTL